MVFQGQFISSRLSRSCQLNRPLLTTLFQQRKCARVGLPESPTSMGEHDREQSYRTRNSPWRLLQVELSLLLLLLLLLGIWKRS